MFLLNFVVFFVILLNFVLFFCNFISSCCDFLSSCCVFCDFIKFCCVFCDFISSCCDFISSCCVFCDFIKFCCVFTMFCCVLVVKISLFLCFRFGFIVDNNFWVLIPLFYTIKLIISLDSSIVKSTRFKSTDSIYISQQQNARK